MMATRGFWAGGGVGPRGPPQVKDPTSGCGPPAGRPDQSQERRRLPSLSKAVYAGRAGRAGV